MVAALAVAGCGGGDDGDGDDFGDSLRVLTFNSYLLSPTFQCGGVGPACHLGNDLGASINWRANRVADALDDGYFDLIGLNEAWDEDDAKDVLVNRLGSVYPNWVKYVDVFGGGVEEDSGLMIFSKWPFADLADHAFASEDSETSLGDDSDHVAFRKFDDCESSDCMAGKGVAMIRAIQPGTERIVNFATTHLNADYPEDDEFFPATRKEQLADAKALMQTSVGEDPADPADWPNRDWMILSGDLNIRGLGAAGEAMHPADNPNHGPVSGSPDDPVQEWWERIGEPPAVDERERFYDAWAETTSELDHGRTRDDEEGRLDYILMSRRAQRDRTPSADPACVQHVWIPPELEGISDHKPVAADINRFNTHCNPRLAHRVTRVDAGDAGSFGKKAVKLPKASLAQGGKEVSGGWLPPGGMQWYRIDDPGTWVAALDPGGVSEGVEFDIYQAKSLSEPLGGDVELETDTIETCEEEGGEYYACRKTEGTKFVLPEAPYYVRVFNPDRSWEGAYSISFYRYSCASPEEACDLLPNAPFGFDFPSPNCNPSCQRLNPDDAAWFRVRILNQADSGKPQSLRLYAHASSGTPQQPKLELYAEDTTTPLTSFDVPVNGPNFPVDIQHGLGRAIADGRTPHNQVVFMKVARPDDDKPLHLDMGWWTNLMIADGLGLGPRRPTLVCLDETDGTLGSEAGVDEINLQVKVDNGGWANRGYHEFQCNDSQDRAWWDSDLGVIKYLSQIEFRLREDDSPAPADHSAAEKFHWAFDADVTKKDRAPIATFGFEDGSYQFLFNLGKWLDE